MMDNSQAILDALAAIDGHDRPQPAYAPCPTPWFVLTDGGWQPFDRPALSAIVDHW